MSGGGSSRAKPVPVLASGKPGKPEGISYCCSHQDESHVAQNDDTNIASWGGGRPASSSPCRPRSKPAQGSQCLLPTTLPGIQQGQFQSPCPSLEMCMAWMFSPFHLLPHLVFAGGIASHTCTREYLEKSAPSPKSLQDFLPTALQIKPKVQDKFMDP